MRILRRRGIRELSRRLLVEFPADDLDRARRFWQGLLDTTLAERQPEQGEGWQTEHAGAAVGLHERGSGPGDRFSLPYLPVADLQAALGQVVELGDLPRFRRHAVRPRRAVTPARQPADPATQDGRWATPAGLSVTVFDYRLA